MSFENPLPWKPLMTTTSRKPKTAKPSPAQKRTAARQAVELIRERGLAPGELGALLGLSQAWLTRARGVGLPRRSDGRHDVAAVVEWARARDRERTPHGARESVMLERWRAARAEGAEFEAEVRRRQFVPRAEVVQFAGESFALVRQRLLALVRRMAGTFGPQIGDGGEGYVQETLQHEVDSICAAFARSMAPADHPDLVNAQFAETAAKQNSGTASTSTPSSSTRPTKADATGSDEPTNTTTDATAARDGRGVLTTTTPASTGTNPNEE